MVKFNHLFKFIGEDGSMGFRNGDIYLLQIVGNKMVAIDDGPAQSMVSIESSAPKAMKRYQYCPYTSWFSFFDNWERV